GFDGAKAQPQRADWARLELAEPIPAAVSPLTIETEAPAPGTPLALAGYNQDRSQLLVADTDCHVIAAVRSPDGGAFFTHDCAATHGTSGAPVLARQAGRWIIAGINIAAGAMPIWRWPPPTPVREPHPRLSPEAVRSASVSRCVL